MLEQPLCLTLSKTMCHYSSTPNEVSATFHMALTQAPHIEGIRSYGSCAGRRCGGCWPAIDDSLPRQFMGREFGKRPVPEKSADMVFPHLPAHAQPNRSCPFSNCTPTMQIGKASTAAPVSSIFSLITSSLWLWWLFPYCSQDRNFCSLVPRRQSDEGTSLSLGNKPQPFDFFHRPNGHDQVDVALA